MNLPHVSVIIPCYNCVEYLDRGLGSILNQTYKNLEIICIDNNSTDNTYDELLKWKKRYDNIKVYQELKKGAPYARNLGTELAKGIWIQYFDIDDVLKPDKIQHQIQLILKSDIDPDFVIEGWETQTLDQKIYKNILDKEVWLGIFTGRISNTNSVLLKKDLLIKVGLWNTQLESSQERELFFRILKVKPKIIWSEALNSRTIKRVGSISMNPEKSDQIKLNYAKLRYDIIQFVSINLKDIFISYKNKYLNGMFETIRFTYQVDKKFTIEVHAFIKSKGFDIKKANVSRKYRLFYSIFGFKMTEKIYSKVKK